MLTFSKLSHTENALGLKKNKVFIPSSGKFTEVRFPLKFLSGKILRKSVNCKEH